VSSRLSPQPRHHLVRCRAVFRIVLEHEAPLVLRQFKIVGILRVCRWSVKLLHLEERALLALPSSSIILILLLWRRLRYNTLLLLFAFALAAAVHEIPQVWELLFGVGQLARGNVLSDVEVEGRGLWLELRLGWLFRLGCGLLLGLHLLRRSMLVKSTTHRHSSHLLLLKALIWHTHHLLLIHHVRIIHLGTETHVAHLIIDHLDLLLVHHLLLTGGHAHLLRRELLLRETALIHILLLIHLLLRILELLRWVASLHHHLLLLGIHVLLEIVLLLAVERVIETVWIKSVLVEITHLV